MKLIQRLITWIFPCRCAVCDTVIHDGKLICENCKKYFLHPTKNKNACKTCSLPAKICCCGRHLYYDKLAAPFQSTSPAKKSVYKIKFKGRRDLIPSYAHFIKMSLDERGLTYGIDVITFIPMLKINKFKRGFNQAEELAKALSAETGIKCVPLLYKYCKTPSQHSLKSSIMRSGNVLGIYEPIAKNIEIFKDKTVLLTDDIVTSGSTLSEAAKTLKIFGADKVYCAAALMTVNKHKAATHNEKLYICQ